MALVPKPQGTFQWIGNFGKPNQTFLNWVESLDAYVRLVANPQVYAKLPPASSSQGRLATVTDSTTAVWGATIAGGGGNVVLAFCDGANWTVAGK